MVVAEALACGLPVILSRKVNIWREIVHHWAGIAGEDTVEGTTESLQLWSEHTPEEIEAFGDRARDCFDRHFNLNRTSKSVLQIFENLAESNPQYSPDPVFAPGSK
jgi:glycosyltransferase involved in cell wall biosynthesis